MAVKMPDSLMAQLPMPVPPIPIESGIITFQELTDSSSPSVPEPSSIIGLGLLTAVGAGLKLKKIMA